MVNKSKSRIPRLSKVMIVLLLSVLLAPFGLEAYGRKMEQPNALAELQNCYSNLQHQLSNSRCEIKTFEERLLNFEVMLDSLRDEISASKDQQKETLQARNHSLELRIAALEQSSKAISSDFKQLNNHLKANQQKLSEIDHALSQQGKNFLNLQNAVTALLEAVQEKPDGLETCYTIKNGDNLAKIAKAHQTSVEAIKSLNGLSSDRIIVGKTIKIPLK